ncbi:PREDICTED: UBP1-associated protein 2C-like isoform X2 [Lupinus angustifolius]|uniref:UBP1-associated protein 2C-like isoform X2 n=1 Tax=Lupinus angustifolius TaxID=3871 RepID=UPI00092E9147|nr:PREDICTED: UBP1-associated protein 2C-like isoform X2 [Lupinus angustifolius]
MESQTKTNAEANRNTTATDSPPPFSTLSPHDIHQMLQQFDHDQLLNLLHSAALRHADVRLAIRDLSDLDITFRRLYVRSLGGETTSETLHRVFSSFGEIEEAIVIVEKSTGKSKGFGFVTFKHMDGAYLALKNPSKRINGRMTISHLASAGVSHWDDDVSSRKIFVANIPFVIPPGKLLNHFLRYGEVEEGPLAFDRACGREKGFAFFIYKTEEGAEAAIREPLKVIDGYKMHCRLSVEYKKLNAQTQMMAPEYGGYGGGFYQGQGYTAFYVPPPMVLVPQFGDTSGGGYGGSSRGGGSSSNVDPRRAAPLPPSSSVGAPATASGSQSQGSSSHHEQQPQPKPARKRLPRGM